MKDVGCRMKDLGCRMKDVGCRIKDEGCRILVLHDGKRGESLAQNRNFCGHLRP